MRRARRAWVTVALGLVLAVPALACGEEENAPPPPEAQRAPLPPDPPPGEAAGPGEGEADDRQGGEGDGGRLGSGPASGEDRRDYDPSRPDTAENDVPPPPGSPAERFERTCRGDPSHCD